MVATSRSESSKRQGRKTAYTEQIVVPRLHRPKPRNPRKLSHRAPKARKDLLPGTIVILLNGPYKGKRVVYLKQLPSGMLLVSGPMKVNGVPMRRANQRNVIVTSTKLDVSQLIKSKALDQVKDEIFSTPDSKKAEVKKFRVEASKNRDDTFYNDKVQPQQVGDAFKALQTVVDKSILETVTSDPILTQYLNTRFTLRNADRPHLMKF